MKRKKYSEEVEARLSDEEVKVIVKAKKTGGAVRKEPAVQLFVVSRCAPTIQNSVDYGIVVLSTARTLLFGNEIGSLFSLLNHFSTPS